MTSAHLRYYRAVLEVDQPTWDITSAKRDPEKARVRTQPERKLWRVPPLSIWASRRYFRKRDSAVELKRGECGGFLLPSPGPPREESHPI